MHRPQITSIKYSSPGSVELLLDLYTVGKVAGAITVLGHGDGPKWASLVFWHEQPGRTLSAAHGADVFGSEDCNHQQVGR
jgi:hypothetical protein